MELARREMKRAKRVRDLSVAHAKEFARNEAYEMMAVWLERAARAHPMTPLQLWGVRKIIGSYKYEELKLGRYCDDN